MPTVAELDAKLYLDARQFVAGTTQAVRTFEQGANRIAAQSARVGKTNLSRFCGSQKIVPFGFKFGLQPGR